MSQMAADEKQVRSFICDICDICGFKFS